MLPRDKHGVVDTNLKVYGTSNLRVADLSIVPLQVAAHTQCESSCHYTHEAETEVRHSVGVCDRGSRYVYAITD